jgi:preprotein translocase subunit YajC
MPNLPSFYLLLQATPVPPAPAPAPAGQPAAPGAPAAPRPPDFFGGFSQLLPVLAFFFLVMYFLVWRPESRKRKEREKMIAAIKKGDDVVLSGGMLGKVWRADGQEVVVVVDESKDVAIKFLRSAVLEVLPPGGLSAEARQKLGQNVGQEVKAS